MKKKLIILGITVIAMTIGAIAYFSQPQNLINDINRYNIDRIVYKGVDVTNQVDCKTLASIVNNYKCSRLAHAFSPYQESQVIVEISSIDGDHLQHILLGHINIAYGSAHKGGFSILNSSKLLNEILIAMPYLTEEERGLKEKKVITFSDGENVNLWRTDYSNSDIYKLSDGTTLLTIHDPTGPNNVYVGGVESFDDLNDVAQKTVRTFYKKQGLLYDTQSELKNAYTDYLTCKKYGTEYNERYITQDIAPTASNDAIICFLTLVTLPSGAQIVQEIRSSAVFDRKTGEVLSNWDLFTVPEAEALQRILDACDVDTTLRIEMETAIQPEYMILFPENIELTFPQGTLPSQEYAYSYSLNYNKLKPILQPWAIPNNQVHS